jgi:hypothetical protein
MNLFSNCIPKITSTTKLPDILPLFEGDLEFPLTAEANRPLIFREYVDSQREAEREEERNMRKAYLAKFRALLHSIPQDCTTTWKQVKEMLPEQFGKTDLKKVDMMDILIAFEEWSNSVDSTFRQNRNAKIRARHRREVSLQWLTYSVYNAMSFITC